MIKKKKPIKKKPIKKAVKVIEPEVEVDKSFILEDEFFKTTEEQIQKVKEKPPKQWLSDEQYDKIYERLLYIESKSKEASIIEPQISKEPIQEPQIKEYIENIKLCIAENPFHKKQLELKMYREPILAEIKDFMKDKLRRSSGTTDEINKMFQLYNAYYKANEDPSCTSCINTVYRQLVKLC